MKKIILGLAFSYSALATLPNYQIGDLINYRLNNFVNCDSRDIASVEFVEYKIIDIDISQEIPYKMTQTFRDDQGNITYFWEGWTTAFQPYFNNHNDWAHFCNKNNYNHVVVQTPAGTFPSCKESFDDGQGFSGATYYAVTPLTSASRQIYMDSNSCEGQDAILENYNFGND